MSGFPLPTEATTAEGPEDRSVLLPRARRAVAGVVLLAAFLGLYAFSNLTALGQSLENSWARQYTVTTPGLVLDDSDWFPPFHNDVATIVVGVLLAVWIAAARRRWRALVTVAVAAPASLVAGQLFKHVAGRPHLVPSLDVDPSYPSGHAGIALAVTAALLVVIPRRHLRWAAPVLVAWCLLAAGGLMAEGQHRASEVIGSGLLIAAVFCLVSAVVARETDSMPRPAWTRRVGLLLVAGLVVAVVGAWDPVWWQVVVYVLASAIATGAVVLGALAVRTEAPSEERDPAPDTRRTVSVPA